MQDPKSRQKSPSGHHRTNLSGNIFATKARIDNRKKILSSSISSCTCPHNMVNVGPLAAEIVSLVSGTPGNYNGFRVLAALLHGNLVVGVSQTLQRWTEGATYIRQGGHHVGHWPTFLVCFSSPVLRLDLRFTADQCSRRYVWLNDAMSEVNGINNAAVGRLISWELPRRTYMHNKTGKRY